MPALGPPGSLPLYEGYAQVGCVLIQQTAEGHEVRWYRFPQRPIPGVTMTTPAGELVFMYGGVYDDERNFIRGLKA